MPELTDDGVRRGRVAAQLLHRPGRVRPGVGDVVARLLAVQAQDIGAAPLALRARSRGLTVEDVRRARQDRSIVRTWGPRGTLHLIASDDLSWLLPLVLPPVVTTTVRRLAQEGVPGDPDDLVRLAERALAGQGPLTKAQLGERLARLGRPAAGQGIVHLVALAGTRGRVVLGPDSGNKPTYVHATDWLGRELTFETDRERALRELAIRYLRAHYPAGPEDLAAWAGLPLRETRAAWAAIADQLTEVRHRDRPLWRPRRNAANPVLVQVALLPAFDEYLLGWRDRSLIADATYVKRVLTGGGMLPPTVLADGWVVGTWRTTAGATRKTAAAEEHGITLDLLESVDADALRAETADVARFTGSAPRRSPVDHEVRGG